MFEKASRIKLRFGSTKGFLSVEDLWDLSLKNLNSIAKDLNRQLKASNEDDFLKEKNLADVELKLAFDIVLHVLKTKQSENEANKNEILRKQKKERILTILAKKQDESLENLSEKELNKMLED